jgi:hypothetical protein
MNNTLCFTGHRPNKLAGYDKTAYNDFVNDLAISLEAYVVYKGINTFISGGAQGFDQLAFWAVNKLKQNHPEWAIKNIVYVPFVGQESRWSKFGLFSQAEYQQMLNTADEIHICYPDVKPNNDFSIIRNALMGRNEQMVDSSCRVLAMYSQDEDANNKLTPGGTAECVKYAVAKNMPVDRCIYNVINNKLILG